MSNSLEKLYLDYSNLTSNEKLAFWHLVNNHNAINGERRTIKQKNTIKIWPYLDDISQAIIPYSTEHLSEDTNLVVNVDFSQVKRYSSSGAAITLMKLISALSKKPSLYRLIFPEDQNVEKFFQESGFFSILDECFHFVKDDLFSGEIIKSVNPYIISENNKNTKMISFPVYPLKYNKKNDRESVDKFMDWVTDIFVEHLSNSNIKRNIFLTIINEIAKNTQDHTMSDSYFGLDIIRYSIADGGELYFSFSDLGIGIKNNIKAYYSPFDYNKVMEKYSFSDAYKFAFTFGKSTSLNPRNKGIGMSMIRDGAELLNMDLTIWDGRSMLLTPKVLSHSGLRRVIFDTDNFVGFYYYGRLLF
jgi:hypothetical protein